MMRPHYSLIFPSDGVHSAVITVKRLGRQLSIITFISTSKKGRVTWGMGGGGGGLRGNALVFKSDCGLLYWFHVGSNYCGF